MFKIALASLLLLMPSASLAQTADALTHWRRATIAVGQVGPDPSGKGSVFLTFGSAVLVAKDSNHVCLLTAKHVFYDPAKQHFPDFVNVRLPRDAAGEEDLGVKIDLKNGDSTAWKSLDDGSDLAVVDAPDLRKYWNVHAVSLADFGNEGDVYQGAQVLVFGYPGILGQSFLETPLARGGIVSWIDPVNGLDVPFLIDANIFGGNSGGPVFHARNGVQANGSIALGGGYAFIGIVVQDAREFAPVISKNADSQTYTPDALTGKPFPNYAIVENIGGVGVIEPVKKAKKLVEQSCFK
jgi:hypothetical protein